MMVDGEIRKLVWNFAVREYYTETTSLRQVSLLTTFLSLCLDRDDGSGASGQRQQSR